jgi:hypothetical protein
VWRSHPATRFGVFDLGQSEPSDEVSVGGPDRYSEGIGTQSST